VCKRVLKLLQLDFELSHGVGVLALVELEGELGLIGSEGFKREF
jgi:hypothetical protein